MDTIGKVMNEEMRELAVNVGLKMVMEKIPEGHCPYSYYGNKGIGTVRGCKGFGNNLDCNVCRAQFYRDMMRKIQSEVAAW